MVSERPVLPSDQLENRSCVPLPEYWGEVVAMVCWLPVAHWNVHNEAQAAPSTVSEAPARLLVTVWPENGTKFAVAVTAPFITTS